MRLRKVAAGLALTVAAMATLSACTSKIGQAASVDGHSIRDSDISPYLNPHGVSPSDAANAAAQGASVEPRAQIVSILVQERLFTTVLSRTGGVPSEADLAKVLVPAAEDFITQGQAPPAKFAKLLGDDVETLGFTRSYATAVIRTSELEYSVVVRLKATDPTSLAAGVNKLKINVSVSGRYGAWVPAQLGLSNSPTAGLPRFVKLAPTPTLSTSASPSPAG